MKGFFRPIRSIWDYLAFFEFGLSDRPRLYLVLWALGLALSIGVGRITTTDWGGYGWLALPAFLAGSLIKVATGLIDPRKGPTYTFRDDPVLAERIKTSEPCLEDQARGWRAVPPGRMVDGGVHVNRDFNVTCMANPEWDIAFDETDTGTHYAGVIKEIRKLRVPLKPYALGVVMRKLLDGKALINERKIAIASDFHVGMTALEVYKSSYLATWCSADLAHKSIIESGPSSNRTAWPAKTRVPFRDDAGTLRLDPLSVCSRTRSTQIGINLMGITHDRVLLIATQGSKTMFGHDRRVPLATGSMDWEDREAATTFKDLGRRTALRELREEWGNNAALSKKRPLDFTSFLPLGVFRVPGRSGKPEFAAIATLNWREADLEADRSEVHAWDTPDTPEQASHRYPVPTFAVLVAAVDSLLHKQGEVEDTAPLFGVLICLQDLIEGDPDRIKAALGYD